MRDTLTVEEAAAAIGIAPVTVRWRLKAKTIQGERVGSIWLIPRAEVERAATAGKLRPGRKVKA